MEGTRRGHALTFREEDGKRHVDPVQPRYAGMHVVEKLRHITADRRPCSLVKSRLKPIGARRARPVQGQRRGLYLGQTDCADQRRPMNPRAWA